MPTHLKPCPFCASTKTHVGVFVTIYFVVCDECHADGPAKDTEEEAVDAWNTRRRQHRHDGDGQH